MASEPGKQPRRNDPVPNPAPAPTPSPTGEVKGKPPALFRGIDWLSLLLTTLVVFIGYMYTLAPDLTLQDSGELAVGSYYAGVPHPPGYPVWTIYTWFFTVIIPFGNIAWRVGVSSAFAGALTCGLIAMMVSRGGSMLIESVLELRTLSRRIENWICFVAAFVAGTLIGFNGFMWSQSIIVEVYSLTMLSLVGVLICLMRWTHNPLQYRYLYFAWFLSGIAVNNHQSLFVITIALEVLAMAAQPKLGRVFCFWNSVLFIVGLILNSKTGGSGYDTAVMVIFTLVGLASIVGWVAWSIISKARGGDYLMDAIIAISSVVATMAWGAKGFVFVVGFALAVFLGLDIFFASSKESSPWSPHWRKAIMSGIAFALGAAFYLYMPLTSMTNPPLNWGYPRTVAGFKHAFTRGQYEKIHPTAGQGNNIVEQASSWVSRYSQQVWYILVEGPIEEFNLVYVLFAFLPLFFLRRLQQRERAWLIGIIAFYIVLGPFLLELFNPAPDRQSLSLNKPFFIASHVIIAMLVGYGLILLLASVAANDRKILVPVLAMLGCMLLLVTGNFLISFAFAVIATLRKTGQGISSAMMTLIPVIPIAIGTTVAYLAFRAGGTDIPAHRRVRGGLLGLLIVVLFMAVYHVVWVFDETPYSMLRITSISGLVLALLAIGITALSINRSPVPGLLAVTLLMPAYPMLGHWSENEQRDHFFGYWFGHDMFTPPFKNKQGKLSYDKKEREELMKAPEGQKFIYPEMAKDTILFGGTDPGRFCPTYMIFCESFVPPKDKPRDPDFDRRDVYIITQNALADGTYLQYIRAHYYRSDEYKYDTPFFDELFRSDQERENGFKTNLLARLVAAPLDRFFIKTIGDSVEKDRRAGTSFFKPDHFTDVASFAKKLEQGGAPAALSTYLRDQLSDKTRKMLGTPGKDLAKNLAEDLNKLLNEELDGNQQLAELRSRAGLTNIIKDSELREARQKIDHYSKFVPLYTKERFQGVTVTPYLQQFIDENPRYHTRIRLNRLLLEAAYPEITKSPGGVYPDREIYTPTPDDSSRCFQEYMADAQRRMQMNPPQLKPGEDVRIENGRVQVSGQVAVMAINGLLTKVIFDKNPNSEFYVEESFPLDWMYPHLTPYGIIMKINRQQLTELTQEIVDRDHKFWSDYSERLIGNWITYDTPVSNIVAFAESVYLRKDFSKYPNADRRFVRDDDGQKAFSKLRSSIAGVYAWRLQYAKSQAESERMFKEAEFAFKQAYAFCPYSPEALFRYVNLLAGVRRFDDALLIAQTSHKLDPGNAQLDNLVKELRRLRENTPAGLQKAENDYRANKTNFALAVAFAREAAQIGDVARVLGVADDIIANPNADATAVQFAMNIYTQPQIQNYAKLEVALRRWVQINPQPESWIDLAGAQAVQGKNTDAIASLKQALALDTVRKKNDPKASNNIIAQIEANPGLGNLRTTPEYKALMTPNK